ncbi:MAG: hypothetical protein WCJ57_04440 [Candidatus Falkowbacteria bacterium]
MGERPIFKIDNHYVRDFNKEDAEVLGHEILDKFCSEPMKNELIKTPEEIKLIDSFNEYLAQDFRRLGLEEYHPFPAEKVHLLTAADFKENLSRISLDSDYGLYSPHVHAAVLNKEKATSRLDLFQSIAHEMTHGASFRLYEKSPDENRVYENYKTGYRSNKFSGLNEAVTDLVVYQFFLNNQKKLTEDLNITPEEWDGFEAVSYREYCNLVNKIMEVIAQKNNEGVSAVWKRFRLGLFSGTMMHLREVENSLEPGALRQLANLGYKDGVDQEILDYLNQVISEKKK